MDDSTFFTDRTNYLTALEQIGVAVYKTSDCMSDTHQKGYAIHIRDNPY